MPVRSPRAVCASVRDIAREAELGPPALAMMRDGMTSDAFALALGNAGHFRDALGFVAHWLGKREAVWWGCQCLWLVFAFKSTPALQAALQSVVRWVLDPNETTRRQCEAASKLLTSAHPVGALALAAFASSGSIGAPGGTPVEPPARLTASAVSGALLDAACRFPETPTICQQFLRLGLEIGRGQNLWA
jgi:hypothetical protein